MCNATRNQDLVGLTTPALLPNSPEQEGHQSLWRNKKLFFRIRIPYAAKQEYTRDTPAAFSCISTY
jgi:hypothetical protein